MDKYWRAEIQAWDHIRLEHEAHFKMLEATNPDRSPVEELARMLRAGECHVPHNQIYVRIDGDTGWAS